MIRDCGLCPDPARNDRIRRPKDDHGLRGTQGGFDGLVEDLAGLKRIVPPYLETFRTECIGKAPRDFGVGPCVGDEDIWRGQANEPQY